MRLRMWKWIVNKETKHANYLMGVLFVKWHEIYMCMIENCIRMTTGKIWMHFDLSVPTELIMNVLDYNCAKMQQVKVLRENVDFYII